MPSTVTEPPDAEQAARRPRFSAGATVRLADGRFWSLPRRVDSRDEPEYDALIAAVRQAEDHREALFAGHVLLIHLLDRNYALSPDVLGALLSFPAGDPALAQLQRDVLELACGAGGGR